MEGGVAGLVVFSAADPVLGCGLFWVPVTVDLDTVTAPEVSCVVPVVSADWVSVGLVSAVVVAWAEGAVGSSPLLPVVRSLQEVNTARQAASERRAAAEAPVFWIRFLNPCIKNPPFLLMKILHTV